MGPYRHNAEDPDERTRLVRRNRALERWFRIFRASLWPVRAWKQLRAWYAKQQVQLRTPARPFTLPAPIPPPQPPPRQPKVMFSRYYNRAIDSIEVDGTPVFTLSFPEDVTPLSFAVPYEDVDEITMIMWDIRKTFMAIRPMSSGLPSSFYDYKYPWYDGTTGERISDTEILRLIHDAESMRCCMCSTEDASALRAWRAKRVQDYRAAGMYF